MRIVLESALKNFFDTNTDMVGVITKRKLKFNSDFGDILYYTYVHSDHRVVFKALQLFFKFFRYPFVKRILMMEIISETDNQFKVQFLLNVFVDISNYIEKKLEIFSIYKTNIAEHLFLVV